MSPLVLQEITYTWTKASRDSNLAERRRQLPVAVNLPECSAGKDILHKVGYSEQDAFTEPKVEVAADSLVTPLQSGCVTVEWVSSTLSVHYQYRPACGGLPARAADARQTLLAPGQWLHITYNGRIPGAEGALWIYFKRIVNVGLAAPLLRRDWFVVTAPTLVWDESVAMSL